MNPDGLTSYLLTQGVLGVAVIALGWVCVKLYSKCERLEKEKSDLQEARRVDALDSLKQATDILQGNATAIRILTEKIEAGKSGGAA